MPDLIFDVIDGFPENLRGAVAQKDGKYVLALPGDSIPGYVPKQKLDEFRDNNIALARDRDELAGKVKKFGDLDPAKAAAAIAKIEELEKSGKITGADADARIAAITAEHASALSAVRGELETVRAESAARQERIFTLEIETGLAAIFADDKLGLQPSALHDAVDAARLCWKPKDGKLVPFTSDGKVDYNGNGEPKSLREWTEAKAKERQHWRLQSRGSGGTGNPTGGGLQPGIDPMKLSPSERMRLGRRAAA